MTTLTSNQGLILPAGSDTNNVPGSFDDYNDGVENRLVQRYLSSADRLVRNPTPNTGELSYIIDAGRYERYTGSTWARIVPAGYVGTTVRTSAPGSFTAETVIDTLTLTAEPTQRYMVTALPNYQSSVANDLVQLRLRWQAGGTLTTAGTEFHSLLLNCAVASRGEQAILQRDITGLSGQVTVGVTAARSSGTGNITMFGSSSQNNVLFVVAV